MIHNCAGMVVKDQGIEAKLDDGCSNVLAWCDMTVVIRLAPPGRALQSSFSSFPLVSSMFAKILPKTLEDDVKSGGIF